MKSSASAWAGISRTLRYTMNLTSGAKVRISRSRRVPSRVSMY